VRPRSTWNVPGSLNQKRRVVPAPGLSSQTGFAGRLRRLRQPERSA
jgi:hypothetical protein